MLDQALKINSWGKNIYVKYQLILKEIFRKIIKELNNKNIKLNVTAVYNSNQTKNFK